MNQQENPRLQELFRRLWHGGDYNPEQWPEDVTIEDVRLMREANVSIATLGVFSWACLEPEDGRYDWSWFDRTIDRLHQGGIRLCLATPSAAHPRWLTQKHPDVMCVMESSQRRHHGVRQFFCPSSPARRQYTLRINRALVERYGKHPALVLWHVSNEYSGHGCWCELCAAGFRQWLQQRYGSLQELDRQWCGAFWSQRCTHWDQIEPPMANGEMGWQGLRLDWMRYHSTLECEFFKMECQPLRELTPRIPITTNLMGPFDRLDYAKFADAMDAVSNDSYPQVGQDPADIAFANSYIRGLKSGQRWIQMEQSPSATNWMEHATLKPPGSMRLWSWQAIGHGANSAMYFQWRRSRGGPEKFHGAVVEHAGRSDARVFQEVSAHGAELDRLTPLLAPSTPATARIGVLFDREAAWAFGYSGGPGKDKPYKATVRKHYKAIWSRNLPVDIVRMSNDWSRYKLLIAPMLYMVKSGSFPLQGTREELLGRVDEGRKIADWVAAGGRFVTTYLSGIVNESDLVYAGGYPGPLKKLLGIWVEEIDNGPGENAVVCDAATLPGLRQSYACKQYFDQIVPEGAEVLARYASNWYQGRPVLTRHGHGQGQAYYLGTDPEIAFLEDFYGRLAQELGVRPLLPATPNVEVLQRDTAGQRFLIVLNHASEARTQALGDQAFTDAATGERVAGELALPPYAVRILMTQS